MVTSQLWNDFPFEKLRLKISKSSCLALGPRALRNVVRGSAFGAYLEGGPIEFLFSQGSTAAFSSNRRFQRRFQPIDAVLFFLVVTQAAGCCVGFALLSGEGTARCVVGAPQILLRRGSRQQLDSSRAGRVKAVL